MFCDSPSRAPRSPLGGDRPRAELGLEPLERLQVGDSAAFEVGHGFAVGHVDGRPGRERSYGRPPVDKCDAKCGADALQRRAQVGERVRIAAEALAVGRLAQVGGAQRRHRHGVGPGAGAECRPEAGFELLQLAGQVAQAVRERGAAPPRGSAERLGGVARVDERPPRIELPVQVGLAPRDNGGAAPLSLVRVPPPDDKLSAADAHETEGRVAGGHSIGRRRMRFNNMLEHDCICYGYSVAMQCYMVECPLDKQTPRRLRSRAGRGKSKKQTGGRAPQGRAPAPPKEFFSIGAHSKITAAAVPTAAVLTAAVPTAASSSALSTAVAVQKNNLGTTTDETECALALVDGVCTRNRDVLGTVASLLPSAAATAPAEIMHGAAALLRCDPSSESCVLEHPALLAAARKRATTKALAAELATSFKQPGPRLSTAWLSNVDIDGVLGRWVREFPDCFACPYAMADFDTNGDVFGKTNLAELRAGKYRTFACVHNLDNSRGRGSHWVAVFVDMRADPAGPGDWTIEYFNSAGSPPAKPLVHWAERTKRALAELRARLAGSAGGAASAGGAVTVWNVTSVRHQHSHTECGPYALYYIRRRLEGDPLSVFSARVPDEWMVRFRRHLFRLKGGVKI